MKNDDEKMSLKIPKATLDALKDEQYSRRKNTGAEPTLAELIQEAVNGLIGKIPDEKNSKSDRNVLQSSNDPTAPVALEYIQKTLQVIEEKCGIDYGRIEQAVIEAIESLHLDKISAELSEIARVKPRNPGASATGRRRTARHDRSRVPA